jgi:hypothetical protein
MARMHALLCFVGVIHATEFADVLKVRRTDFLGMTVLIQKHMFFAIHQIGCTSPNLKQTLSDDDLCLEIRSLGACFQKLD